ncbi:hypothetical protein [Streptomyces lushanensis]|uniref:hypothetical protein n=1 Tax=Streptomyces lushanensis TaxID=1434255 RepID=UPI001FDF0B5B|nr:hypothetical protein [Streptomyces lushanensis]
MKSTPSPGRATSRTARATASASFWRLCGVRRYAPTGNSAASAAPAAATVTAPRSARGRVARRRIRSSAAPTSRARPMVYERT